MASTEQDRRAAERRPIHLSLVVSGTNPDGGDFREVTTSINISATGAYFPFYRPLTENCELDVAIIPPSQVGGGLDVRFRAHSRVVRAEPTGAPTAPTRLAIQFTEAIHLG